MAVIINNKKVAGVGKPGVPGKSAYELAKQTGYEGSELDLSLALNKIDDIEESVKDVENKLSTKQDNLYIKTPEWNEANLPISGDWTSIAYGDGKYIAISSGNNKVAISTDAISWTEHPVPTGNYSLIAYGNGKFVVAGYGKIIYSVNGINWTEVELAPGDYWGALTYGEGKGFVALATGKAAYSADGITWSVNTLPITGYWYGFTYGNGRYVAVGWESNNAIYSTDGINWTISTLPGNNQRWVSITYGNDRFVAVADYLGNMGAVSEDGVNWTQSVVGFSNDWTSIAFGNGVFVATGWFSAYSTDGINWFGHNVIDKVYSEAVQYTYVMYGGDRFVAVSYGTDKVMYSTPVEAINPNFEIDMNALMKRNMPDALGSLYDCNINLEKGRIDLVYGDDEVILDWSGLDIQHNGNKKTSVSDEYVYFWQGDGHVYGLDTPTMDNEAANKKYVDDAVAASKDSLNKETWTFTLEDGSTVTKVVYVG